MCWKNNEWVKSGSKVPHFFYVDLGGVNERKTANAQTGPALGTAGMENSTEIHDSSRTSEAGSGSRDFRFAYFKPAIRAVIASARRSPLWDGCGAQVDEAVRI